MNKDSYHSMKRGLALSLVAHVIFLSWGAVYFINPVSLPQQLEAIPITLAPLTQELSSQQGAVNAPLREIPAVKPTVKPQEKEDAHHVGEGQIDSSAPFKPKEKPRPIETTPSPSEEEKTPELTEQELTAAKIEIPLEKAPEAVSEVVPEIPLEKAPEAASEVVPEIPLEKAPEAASEVVPEVPLEKTPEAVSEVVPEVLLEKTPEAVSEIVPKVLLESHKNEEVVSPQKLAPRVEKVPVEPAPAHQQVSQIMLPDKSPFPQFKPKSAPQNVQADKKNNHQRVEKSIEDILAMEKNNLLNRAHTQGGGAKRSDSLEALGARKNIGDITKMAQTLVSIAGRCIQQKLKLVALGGDLKNRPVVRLRFYLNREGMVIGDPIIDPLGGAQSQQAIMIRQVYAAVFSCQPYADLPRDQYDLWGQGFDFNVDPLQEITR
ncbi:cell envelope biogenesis protein TolA [Bartonella taylorii]|uniref:cell envelope biogenesis protein TolA n=1 Tax=Bartonella taylorii TaxID=33046 RepID=UPI001ABB8C9F|nr:cell envelope biogenesis protein TolA [Bartonella taylorii]